MTGQKNIIKVVIILAFLMSIVIFLNYSPSLTGNLVYDSKALFNEFLDVEILIGDKINKLTDHIEIIFDDDIVFKGSVQNLFDVKVIVGSNNLSSFEEIKDYTFKNNLKGNILIKPDLIITLNITGNKTTALDQNNLTLTNITYFLNYNGSQLNLEENEFQIIENYKNLNSNLTINEYLNQTNNTLNEQILNIVNQNEFSLSNQSNSFNIIVPASIIQQKYNNIINISENSNLNNLVNVSIDEYDWNITKLSHTIESNNDNIILGNLKIQEIYFDSVNPSIVFNNNTININENKISAEFILTLDDVQLKFANLKNIENTVNYSNDIISNLLENNLNWYEISQINGEFISEDTNLDYEVQKINDFDYIINGTKDTLFFDFSNLSINTREFDYKSNSDTLGKKNFTLKVTIDKNTKQYDYTIDLATSCQENWVCKPGTCLADNTQKNNCIDENGCGTQFLKPVETKACVYSCTQNWNCTEFSQCNELNFQFRVCTDKNNCQKYNNTATKLIEKEKLSEIQSCKDNCNEDWRCTSWSSCSKDQIYRSCTDKNTCGSEILKPKVEASCNEIVDDQYLKIYEKFLESENYVNLLNPKKNEKTAKNTLIEKKEEKKETKTENRLVGFSIKEEDNSTSSGKIIIFVLIAMGVLSFTFNERGNIKQFVGESNKKEYFKNYLNIKKQKVLQLFNRNNDENNQNNQENNQFNNLSYNYSNNIQSSNMDNNVNNNDTNNNSDNQNNFNQNIKINNYNPNNQSQQLNSYLNYYQKLGYNDYQIKSFLMQKGYNLSQINGSFNSQLGQNNNENNNIKKEFHFATAESNKKTHQITVNKNIFNNALGLLKNDFGIAKAPTSLVAKRNFSFTISLIEKNVDENTIIEILKKKDISESNALELIDRAKEKLNKF